MEKQKIINNFIRTRQYWETYKADGLQKDVYTPPQSPEEAVVLLESMGFSIQGEAKNIIYGPFISDIVGIGQKELTELCRAGWTAVDTICPRRAKMAFIIECYGGEKTV